MNPIDAEMDYLTYRDSRTIGLPLQAIVAFFGSRAVMHEARYLSEQAQVGADKDREKAGEYATEMKEHAHD